MNDEKSNQITADTPGLYVIVVQGSLDVSWSDRLAGMQMIPGSHHEESTVQLTGWLIDQAALNGILNVLFALSLPVLSIERLA